MRGSLLRVLAEPASRGHELMGATSSFLAGLIAGALVILGTLLFRRASQAASRSRKLPLAGGIAALTLVVVIVAISLATNSRHALGTAPPRDPAVPPPGTPSSGMQAAAEMPAASVMSRILAMPGTGQRRTAEPMDEAAAGLAARLERQGGTAADWSLLAQAYDFLDRPEDARRARAHAAQVRATQRTP